MQDLLAKASPLLAAHGHRADWVDSLGTTFAGRRYCYGSKDGASRGTFVVSRKGSVRACDWRDTWYARGRRLWRFICDMKHYEVGIKKVGGYWGVYIRDLRPTFGDLMQDIGRMCAGKRPVFLKE